ncbi:MAG: hypothetical protein CVU54_08210 [Deltaproteobacteria bacterium HGW-Deltaproteobacteria-12]|nr:MAG: hypothetical protein CVU54_08210 [Deltaproteobacteria bacterium HGW-Deltaproteobacteria-12]
MSSKSKDVRIEQRRILEKKLELRLQQLAQKGISKEKGLSDPLVKNLKAKIRETNIRIKAIEKFVQLNAALAQAKVQKLADLAKKEEAAEPVVPEAKQKKKAAGAEKEAKPKKKTDNAETAEPKKQPRKKKEE